MKSLNLIYNKGGIPNKIGNKINERIENTYEHWYEEGERYDVHTVKFGVERSQHRKDEGNVATNLRVLLVVQ